MSAVFTVPELEQQLEQALNEGTLLVMRPLAEQLLAQVAELPTNPETAETLALLVKAFRANHDTERARSCAGQALAIRREFFGPLAPETARSLSAYADVLKDAGHYDDARAYYECSIETLSETLGGEHPDTLSVVHDLGLLFKSAGDVRTARTLIERALSGMQRSFGEEHLDTANCRNSLAGCLWELGDLVSARRELELALSIRIRHLGEQHPDVADILSSLGIVLSELGDSRDGLDHLERALRSQEVTLGLTHPQVGIVLNNLAMVHADMGQMAKAKEYLLRTLSLRREVFGDEHPDTADAYDNLGAFHQQVGHLDLALADLEHALKIRQRTLGDEHPATLQTWGRLALLLDVKGDFEASLPIHRRVLAARRAKLGDLHPDTCASFNNLGRCLLRTTDFRGARDNLELALASARAIYKNAHSMLGTILNNLGVAYDHMGDADRATEMQLEALELRRQVLVTDHPDIAESLINVAGLLMSAGDADRARAHYEEALDILRSVFGEQHPDTATCLTNLGLLLGRLEEFDAAEEYLEHALTVRRRLFGEQHPSTANGIHNLGHLRLLRGDLEGARIALEDALALNRKVFGEVNPITAATLADLMCLYAGTGMPDRAFELARDLGRCDDVLLTNVFSIASERQRTAVRESIQDHFHVVLAFLMRALPNLEGAVEFAVDLVLRRKATGMEALIAQRAAAHVDRYQNLGSAFEELRQLKTQITANAVSANHAASKQAVSDWTAASERLEEELVGQIAELSLERELMSVDCEAVIQALPAGSVLVEFIRYQDFDFEMGKDPSRRFRQDARYLALIVRGRESGQGMVDLGLAEPIDRLVENFNMLIATPPAKRAGGAVEEAGATLRTKVFDPLVPHFGNAMAVLLAPDGLLNELSFGVLPISSGRFVTDDYRVSYLSVGRDLARFAQQSNARPGSSVVVADPAFNALAKPGADKSLQRRTEHEEAPDAVDPRFRRAMRFSRLKGSREEGERVAALLGVEPLFGKQAMDGVVKQLQSPRILHIATHGFFLQEALESSAAWSRLSGPGMKDPLLRSGLALAGANVWLCGHEIIEEGEDGLLTAEDVSHMNLQGTELVTLSACETALGAIHAGEGVLGLRRAFAVAGARRLVISLWKIPDQETTELMVEFYKRLLTGTETAEALRAAQASLRGRPTDPFYWGAFLLLGDPRAMAGEP